MIDFQLGPLIEENSTFVADLQLSQLRIYHNANFPWLLLIPRVAGVSEITDLSKSDYQMLSAELRLTANILQYIFKPDTINICLISNNIKQLHYHLICRYENDINYPEVAFNASKAEYTNIELQLRVDNIKNMLNN